MKAKFSIPMVSFIPENMIKDGSYGEEVINGLVDVTDEELALYWKTSPPEGKNLGVIDGRPAWVDLPPLTHEELVTEAIAKQKQLKAIADSEIDWRQDAVDGNYAEADEVTELSAWKKYRVLLMRTDTLKAPDIKWPVSPE